MIELPAKGQEVSLEEIELICKERGWDALWEKIKRDPPKLTFKSDGCSGGWPDTWNEYNLYPLCWKHDLSYWAGYSDEEVERLIADAELMIGVARMTGDIDLAQIMFAGVRAGGGHFWKKPFSWGFGRKE